MPRMERYQEQQATPTKVKSRVEKNNRLYNQVYQNEIYQEITDMKLKNVVDLDQVNNQNKTREEYHKIKDYEQILGTPKVKKDLEEFNTLYPIENKVYDINEVIKEKKNARGDSDNQEEKRKLHADLHIGISEEELLKFREEKKKKLEKEQNDLMGQVEKEIEKKDVQENKENKELLAELLPVTEEEEKTPNQSQLEEMDKSFYTKSMDFSEEDFVGENEKNEEDDELAVFDDINEQHGILKKALYVLLFIVMIAIVTTVIYYVVNLM